MVTYSYIPPEYKANNKISPTPHTPLSSQQTNVGRNDKTHIPYRDTGAAGKSIFGQPPSWAYKPLPPLPFGNAADSPTKPLLSKFYEHDCDTTSLIGQPDKSDFKTKAKKSKIAKVVKNFSKKLLSTGSNQ
jgi:hypothetical protein